MTYADKSVLAEVDKKAEAMKAKILGAPSEYPRNAGKYYVSNSGDDANDGRTPETAIRTVGKLNSMDVRPGEVVLFERGGVWRDAPLYTKISVTYSAYGTGAKPMICGNGGTAEGADAWEKTDVPNVWKLCRAIVPDVGNILFDGKYSSRKRFAPMKKTDANGKTYETRPDGVGPYTGLTDLKENLQFHHDKTDNHVYLYCDKGNPGTVYKTAEVMIHGNAVILTHGVTVDNLCVRCSGSHGLGGGYGVKVTVRSCEIAWCGGSFLTDTTLYGNAVELYGNCDGFHVHDNYIHDIYDTGITHQYWPVNQPAYMHDCHYENNLIERCYWSIEYVSRGEYTDDNRMSDIRICGNILRCAGDESGWGSVRAGGGKTGAHIKGWPIEGPADNFFISDNIIDRCGGYLIDCGVADERYLPEMCGNTYIQYENDGMGYYGLNNPKGRDRLDDSGVGAMIVFDETIEERVRETMGDADGKVYTLKK